MVKENGKTDALSLADDFVDDNLNISVDGVHRPLRVDRLQFALWLVVIENGLRVGVEGVQSLLYGRLVVVSTTA